MSALDRQEGGDHYKKLAMQPLEATYLNFGYEGLKAAVYTKVNKYILRTKDDEVGQLKKARHCLDILIEKAQKEERINREREICSDLRNGSALNMAEAKATENRY